MKVHYYVVENQFLEDLIQNVNNYLAQGWELQGGVATSAHIFYQAIVFRSND